MSPKKRVYDLAKEYGMTGQELAAKLRDLGFQVKSHMSALDDFQVLEIRGRLEAYGIVGESSGQSVSTVGGLKIKRKKKKPATAEPAQAPAEEEPEEEPASQESEPAPESAAPSTEEAPDEPIPAEPVAEEAHEIVGVEADAATDETEPARELEEEAHAPIEEPTAAEESEVPEPTPAEAKASVEVEATEEPVADQELAPEAAAKETAVEGEKAPTKKGAEVVRPSTKRRTGKVVGFIDPSQFQTRPQRKSESRRLRSSDDVVPDVMPTFGRDRASGMVRGDTTRGALTAQQLREREAGRFLRRRRPQQQSGPGGRRHGGGRDASSTDSPFVGGVISIEAPITIKKLANTLAVKENQVMRVALQQLGLGININSGIDEESAILLANEFNVELSVKEEVEAEEALLLSLAEKRGEVEAEHIVTRPPTVAVLGHVDHGKTTLIDTIRRSRITHGEAGGITQHIGAYQIETKAGHVLTIVDTPGHEAFTSMRARGANAVDVVILIVAADDGVKPQTEEAYNHAKVAGAPIVVALNKIDKPEANTERVLNELAGLGLTPEEWGGETAMLQVSALKNEGVDELLERVFLESEVLELRSHPKGPARGVVLEAEIQQGKGKVAHLLVQDGSLNRGDVILAGEGYGKVRSIHDDHGKQIKEAGPSKPVEVTGLNELPMAGDMFHVVGSLDQAQEVAEERARKNRLLSQIERRSISTENLLEAVADQDKPTINLIIKADVQGSAEVLKNQISQLQHAEVDVRVLHSGVGAVLESDVDLAITSDARILAFHTQAQNKVRQAAERGNVEIKSYDVIYELLDDIRKLMEGELAPEIKEEVTGHVEIRRIFKSSRLGNIGGSYVLDGKIRRGSKIRLFRDDKLIHTGLIGSLRRESEDAKEVREGFECGVVLKDYNDIKEGDVVEAYRVYEVKRTL